MNISRRQFGKGGLALAVVAPLAGAGLEGCSTAWISVVLADMPTVVGIIESVLAVITAATKGGILTGNIAAILTEAATALAASLNALKDAVTAYQSTPGAGTLTNLIAALKAAQADAQKVIAALPPGTINVATETVIVAGIGTLVTILSAIQAIIPGALPASVTARLQGSAARAVATSGPIVLPSASALKSGFNSVLILNGYGDYQI